LLVREAGGLVEDMTEGGDPLKSGSIVAAGEQVFSRFAGIVRNA